MLTRKDGELLTDSLVYRLEDTLEPVLSGVQLGWFEIPQLPTPEQFVQEPLVVVIECGFRDLLNLLALGDGIDYPDHRLLSFVLLVDDHQVRILLILVQKGQHHITLAGILLVVLLVREVVLQLRVTQHLGAHAQLFVEFILLLFTARGGVLHLQSFAYLPVIEAFVVLVDETMALEVELEDLLFHSAQYVLDLRLQLWLLHKEVQLDEAQSLVQADEPSDEDVHVIDVITLNIASAHIVGQLAHEVIRLAIVGDDLQ